MGSGRGPLRMSFALISFLIVIPFACGWGYDGHIAVCKIAEARLSKVATKVVKNVLSSTEKDYLGRLCPWADEIRPRYRWSSDLHFINTPDRLCSYQYTRDCGGRNRQTGRCLVGAIKNYTSQLLTYQDKKPRYNLTEALLFLSHFMGDIHQPLHVGFTSDRGGNTINVTYFQRKSVLHHVWDTDLIRTDQQRGFNASNTLDGFVKKIQQGLKSKWANQTSRWETCLGNQKTCPNTYAAESIKAACEWAYKGVRPGSILTDNYFETRSPIVELRIAQAGVRLAAVLNRIFTS